MKSSRHLVSLLVVIIISALSCGAPVPAEFSLHSLGLPPIETEAGNPIAVKVYVTNTGGVEGSYTVTLKVDHVAVSTKEVTLSAGETAPVFFAYSTEGIGIHTVEVDRLTGTFAVVLPPAAPTMTVTSLESGFEVPWRYEIKGIVDEVVISSGLNVYVLVYPVESNGPWWVQPSVEVGPGGYWQTRAYLGRDPAQYPEDIGDLFYVTTIATPMRLEPGQQWDSLPDFVYRSDAMLVGWE